MKQTDRILKYIAEHGSITQREALTELGIMRLASRIHDLRDYGYAVERKMETGRNRYDEPTVYARYYIRGDDECHHMRRSASV